MFATWRFVGGGGMSESCACHCGGMVGGAVLSSVHWSDAPVTPVLVVAGAPSSVGGELVTVGLTGAECRGRVDAMARVR